MYGSEPGRPPQGHGPCRSRRRNCTSPRSRWVRGDPCRSLRWHPLTRHAQGPTRPSTGAPVGLRCRSSNAPCRTARRAPGGLSYMVRCWNDNAGRPVLQYWVVSDLGHAWSGGASAGSYTDPRGPSATEAMCNFFDETGMDRDLAVADPARFHTFSNARAWMIRVRDLGRSGFGTVTNPDRSPG